MIIINFLNYIAKILIYLFKYIIIIIIIYGLVVYEHGLGIRVLMIDFISALIQINELPALIVFKIIFRLLLYMI